MGQVSELASLRILTNVRLYINTHCQDRPHDSWQGLKRVAHCSLS
jgi:hypothetical protein